jgi:fatty-acyl-CoA synthase
MGMAADTRLDSAASRGLLQIEDCLDADGNVALPPDVTLISLIERNIANVGDSVAYRYLDHTRSESGSVTELTWTQLGNRIRAIGAWVQQVASRGDRVAILAPQGLHYVAGFFAAIKAGTIAVCSLPSCKVMHSVSRWHCTTHVRPSCSPRRLPQQPSRPP